MSEVQEAPQAATPKTGSRRGTRSKSVEKRLEAQTAPKSESPQPETPAPASVEHNAPAPRPTLKAEVHSDKFEIQQPGDLDLSLGLEVDTRPSFEVPDGPVDKDYLKELAFMEEIVTVMVHETNDENAIPMVDIYVNGRAQYFPRGVEVKCRRKYLEGLVRAKPMNIRAQAQIPGSGQEPINKVERKIGLAYPFTVVDDKNPNGHAWLRKIMAEG